MTLQKPLSFLIYFLLAKYAPVSSDLSVSEHVPEIFLSEYQDRYSTHPVPTEQSEIRYRTNLTTNIISRNGNVYTIPKNVTLTAIAFACQSKEDPVLWKEDEPGTLGNSPRRAYPIRSSIFISEMTEPENKIFRSYLILNDILAYNEGSVHLKAICLSSKHPDLNSTLELFIKRNPARSSRIETTETAPVVTTQKPHPVTKDGRFQQANINGTGSLSLTQARLTGFSLTPGELTCCSGVASKPYAESYGCVGHEFGLGCEEELMDVEQSFHANYKHFLEDDKNQTTTVSPSSSTSTENCTVTKFGITPNRLVFCKGENVDVLQEYITTFSEPLCDTASFMERLNSKFYTYTLASEVEKLNISQKVIVKLGQPLKEMNKGMSMLLGFTNRGMPSDEYFQGRGMYDSMLRRPSAEEVIRLEEITPNEEVFATGEEVRVMCVYLSYLYANGARLRLNWKNGTKTVIPTDEDFYAEIRFLNHFFSPQGRDWGGIIRRVVGKRIHVHPEMESVDCFVPHLKDSGWDMMRSHPFHNISAPIAPVFSGPPVETVEWAVNDVNASFSCEVTHFPPGLIEIFLNDMRFPEAWPVIDFSEVSTGPPHHTTKKTIKFRVVSEDTFGEYKCFTENLAGSAAKIVRVVKKAK